MRDEWPLLVVWVVALGVVIGVARAGWLTDAGVAAAMLAALVGPPVWWNRHKNSA